MFGDKQIAPRVNSARAETVAEHQMMAGVTPQQQQIRPNAVAELTKTTRTNEANFPLQEMAEKRIFLNMTVLHYWLTIVKAVICRS